MDKELAEIAIGAFLHDIGKISQRGKGVLSSQSENMKSFICPVGKHGGHTHLHTAYTNDFFEGIDGFLPKGLDKSNVANLASYHHRPDTPEQTIIQQADWLSAGQDRRKAEEEDTPRYMRARLNSVFSSIRMCSEPGTSQPKLFSILPQSLDQEAFPKAVQMEEKTDKQYTDLFESAVKHLENLRDVSLDLYLEQLRWVFGLYSWCVPSSQMEASDVSLFDHSLTTAAFAAALYHYHVETKTLETDAICDWNTKKFLLVTGDLSGIQSYIFHFSLEKPAGASKRLRARSFYLSLLTQLASHLILHDLDLPCFSKVLDAGGRFTLLVPNTDNVITRLQQIEKELHSWFLKNYHGRLNLNLSYELQLSGKDFTAEAFTNVSRKLTWLTSKTKFQPFHAKLKSQSTWDQNANLHPFSDREYDEREAEFFYDLGQNLPRVKFLLISTNEQRPQGCLGEKYTDSPYLRPFNRLAIDFDSIYPSRIDNIQSIIQFVPGKEQIDSQGINNGQYVANYIALQSDKDKALYTRPEIAQWLGKEEKSELEITANKSFDKGMPKTFAHLAVDSLTSDANGNLRGQPMLAVLKADVDRLGFIFSHGLGEKLSIGRYATLSRQLDLFFRGYLTNLFQNPPSEHPEFTNIYTVYAGGDDLLFVGPWCTMFNFSIYLHRVFHQYTAENSDVTISAALAVMRHNFPLAQAIAQAEELLIRAKHEGRNKIAVFNTILSWLDFKQAIEEAKFLDRAINEGSDGININKGLVYRLLKYYQMYRDSDNIINKKWRSHLAYDLARNVKTTSGDKNSKPPGLLRLEEMTGLTASTSEMERLKVSVTYCLYMNRGGIL